ncbi:hypothetical protein MG290_10145 [Flavobacterium sp. CBA20B-1]|uniref:hypothetical protein n=1 Tax=unclassified Flavobacterium TaxID=196869 RepID=UPI002225ACF6|nr:MULTISPECIES: hypothetical protein [unclassified Flavobacterium]WCM41316.1 hypothetical protein MG290_10145 [Flavobacterium sp. CBA20B-1]
MNSFQKYPKLSLLFIIKILLIIAFGFSNYYFRSEIDEKIDDIIKIKTQEENNNEIDDFKIKYKIYPIQEDIDSNIDYLTYTPLFLIFLLYIIKDKTDKENKRLDKLEEEN